MPRPRHGMTHEVYQNTWPKSRTRSSRGLVAATGRLLALPNAPHEHPRGDPVERSRHHPRDQYYGGEYDDHLNPPDKKQICEKQLRHVVKKSAYETHADRAEQGRCHTEGQAHPESAHDSCAEAEGKGRAKKRARKERTDYHPYERDGHRGLQSVEDERRKGYDIRQSEPEPGQGSGQKSLEPVKSNRVCGEHRNPQIIL